MDLTPLFKRMGKVAADNSPAILTAIGVTGTLTTAYLAAKAAFKASDVIRDKQAELDKEEKSHPLTVKEMGRLTWELYIPAATCVAMTVTAIICANRISERRTAALAAAYSVVRESYAEYQKGTKKKVGAKKEQEIRDEVAKERAHKRPPASTDTEIVLTGGGTILCQDSWSGRWFTSDVEKIRAAVNDLNAKIINETYVSVNDFWALLDLRPVEGGNHLGWNTDELLELNYTWETINDDRCLIIGFATLPTSKYADPFS